MNEDWNKLLISGIVKHFKQAIEDRDIKFHYETQLRNTKSPVERIELRIIQSGWRRVDAMYWRTRIAVNLYCTVPSGENIVTPANLYRIEELIGICQYELSQSFYIEEMGCLIPGNDRGGFDLDQFRPRQFAPSTNVAEAATTGYYTIEKEIS